MSRAGRMSVARWFIRSDTGRPHMAGWSMTAIKTEPTGPRDSGWLSLAVCPRCYALVLADKEHAYGDQTEAHQRWHAATDFPIPKDVLAQAGSADRE